MSDRRPTLAGSIALLVIGLLVLIPSGLCTGTVLIGQLATIMRNRHFVRGGLGLVPIALIIGGPFVALGGIMIWKGIAGLRARRED